MNLKQINQLIALVTVGSSVLLSACSPDFAFEEVLESCQPPKSSARYGKNIGPVITSPTADTPSNGPLTVSGTCADGFPVLVSGDGVESDVNTTCVAGRFTAGIIFKGSDGKKEVDVSQPTLATGSVMDRLCFNKDTVPPKVLIEGSSGAQAVNTIRMQIGGTCENNLNVQITGPQLIAPVTTSCNSGRFTAQIEFTGPDGMKDIVATQTDLAGNNGNDDEQYLTDMTAPVVSFTTPDAMTLTQGALNIVGTCETGLRVFIQGLTATQTLDCLNSQFSGSIILTGVDGTKNIQATQTDIAGNIGRTFRDFIKDATPPNIQIATPAANTISRDTLTITGTCETGLTVVLSGTGLTANSNATCTSGTFSTVIALSLPDGTKEVIATQTDAAGNSANSRRNFIRDTSAPVITITEPAADSIWVSGITLQGDCESGLTVNISGTGIPNATTTACSANRYSANLLFSNGDGNKEITAAQTDAAGNTGTISRRFIRDGSAPDIRITTPLDNAYVQNTAQLEGSCETGLNVVLSGTGLFSSSTTACNAGNFSSVVTFSNGEGSKVVTAAQTDVAGNTSTDTKTYIKDTTAPAITITAPAASSNHISQLTLVGACETGLTVNISGTGVLANSNTTCTNSSYSSVITLSANDGSKDISVAQTDAAGNSGTATRTFIRDGNPPLLQITAPAANTTAQAGITLLGTCETGLTVNISGTGVQANSTTTCVAGNFSSSILFSTGDGAKIVEVAQTDGAGNTATDSRNFIRDNVGPVILITAPGTNSYVGNTAVISGTCEAGGSIVTLSGTGAESQVLTNCNGGTFSGSMTFTVGDSIKNIVASQLDTAGNTGTDNRDFIRDTTAPNIIITAPAAGTNAVTGLTVSGTCEAGLSVLINGSGLASAVTTTCASGTFSSAIVFSNGDGNKVITANQTDAAGNTGSNSRTFVRDSGAPIVAITAPAINTTGQTGLIVSGTCETGLSVTLDGAGVLTSVTAVCSNGTFSNEILFSNGDGSKLITATQTDLVGNVGSDSRTFNRDSTAPVVAITAPTLNSYVGTTATITGTCENGGSLVVLSGSGVSTPVNAACSAGNFSGLVTFSSGDGSKIVIAQQNDAAGNTGSDTRTFIRDATAPAVAITAPAANTVGITGLTVSGTCEAGLSVLLNGAGVNSAVTTSCPSGTFSSAIVFSNGDGNKVVTASQTDTAGNTATDSRPFVRDSGAPLVAITAPAANTMAQNGLTVSGTCEAGLSVLINGAGVSSIVTTSCASGTFSSAIVFSSGDGNKLVTASQTDSVGNVGSDSRTFIKDATAPVVAITAPAVNSYVTATGTISGSCETGGSAVVLSGAGLSISVNAPCSGGIFSSNVTFSNGDGSKIVLAQQNDAAGNTGSDTRTFIRDATAPVVAITAPAANTVAQNGLTVSGTCEAGFAVLLNGTGVGSPVNTSCDAAGTFSAAILFGIGDGNKIVTASQTDAAGNTGSNSRTFIRDATSPSIFITAPVANTVGQNGLTVSGTCEAGLSVVLNGSGMSSSVTSACSGGTFSSAILFTSGDGSKLITATQTDNVGNTSSDSRTFVRDTTAPLIAITSPAAGTSSGSGLTISGTCESGLTVEMTGNINKTSTACITNVFTVNVTFTGSLGSKVVTASQTDAVGNTGTSSRTYQQSNSAGNEIFTSNGPGGMVDILFVDDNSASMDPEQAALGNRFSSFTAALTGLDWQVGITTTDCTTGSRFNICGSLLAMAGQGASYILNALTPSYLSVFQNTIQRPETLNCLVSGTCPSGREEGLKATISAMTKRNTNNAGFFRNGSDLAIVYLSDENEQSNAPATATSAQAVIDSFKSIWGTSKKLSAYSIIIKPGDVACLNQQRAQLGANAYYGTYFDELSQLTGGVSVSICEPDYSVTLNEIGLNVTRLSRSFDLLETPIPATLSITFTPAHNTTWTLQGNRITFAVPAPAGTQVEIKYNY
jgi:hypothetical protein